MNRLLLPFSIVCVFAATSTLGAQERFAQSPTETKMTEGTPASDTACNYDRCALRFTLSFGTWRVVQGSAGTKLGDLGFLSAPDVESIVRDVPEAADLAKQFRSTYRTSAAFVWGGALVAIVGGGLAAANDGNHSAVAIGIGGLGALAYGGWRHGKSVDLLSRSIWLYNRSLKR